jgi:hypothetical protein
MAWVLDTLAAHSAWSRYVIAKRSSKIPKRAIADILMGASACRSDANLTRNEADFKPAFPTLIGSWLASLLTAGVEPGGGSPVT